MSSEWWFTVLIGLVVLERFVELVISTRHARGALARGGTEVGQGHYGPMVVLHAALLAGALTEVWWQDRTWEPALGWTMLGLVLLAQALRWWCILALGPAWNTRVIVVPGDERVRRGPYRWLPHPNYVAVILEGIALPLVHGAWVTAVVFTVLNAWLLTVRIRTEDRALEMLR